MNSVADETTRKLERQKEALEAIRRQAVETEKVGQSTLDELERQREVLQHASNNIGQTNSNISLASRIVNRLSKWWKKF
jgi:Snare region anchored in the vesicle membrane C-terminus